MTAEGTMGLKQQQATRAAIRAQREREGLPNPVVHHTRGTWEQEAEAKHAEQVRIDRARFAKLSPEKQRAKLTAPQLKALERMHSLGGTCFRGIRDIRSQTFDRLAELALIEPAGMDGRDWSLTPVGLMAVTAVQPKASNGTELIERALGVIVLTPEIRDWLQANDPKALGQALAALTLEAPWVLDGQAS